LRLSMKSMETSKNSSSWICVLSWFWAAEAKRATLQVDQLVCREMGSPPNPVVIYTFKDVCIYIWIYTYICVDNIYILCIPISTFKIVVSGMRCNQSRLLFGLFWPGSAVGLRWICIWELVRMAKPCWWILTNNHWDWLTLDHQYSMKYNNIYTHMIY
jgi:hypothetical protein